MFQNYFSRKFASGNFVIVLDVLVKIDDLNQRRFLVSLNFIANSGLKRKFIKVNFLEKFIILSVWETEKKSSNRKVKI